MNRKATAAVTAVAATLLGGCKPSGQDAIGCGIAAVAAPSVILGEFGVSGATVATAPRSVPSALPVRIAAGKAYRAAAVSEAGDTAQGGRRPLHFRLETMEKVEAPGFGVLVIDRETGQVSGIMLFTGPPLDNAPVLGQVVQDSVKFPLVGLRIDPNKISAKTCAIFPDSLRK